MKVVELLLRTLEAEGVRLIVGNPGTTEVTLVRACEDRPALTFALTLSEAAAVPMADGYARAARALGVVILHVAPGLGNGMGGLYTAATARTPLLVLIGDQDRRLLHAQPVLSGPLERMAGSVAKAVLRLNTEYDAAFNMRRAVRIALTPPCGPVALICPPDILDAEIGGEPEPVRAPALGGLPAGMAERYAEMLASAARPALIAAEDVYWNGACDLLEELARACSAPVYVAPYTPVLPVSSRTPHYAGYLPPSRVQIAERLARHDILFYIGGRSLRTTLYSEADLPQSKLWVGNDPAVLAAEGELALATIADTREALAAILQTLRSAGHQPPPVTGSCRPQVELPVEHQGEFHPSRAVEALLGAFGDAVWVDESGLSTSDVRQWMALEAGEYIIHGSGGIGWGLAASVGVALARPERQVVAIVGDGSALYASEALWTAAHQGTKLLLVVLSNRRYSTLNEAATRFTGRALETFTLEPPVLDFGGLATLYGWQYTRAGSESELRAFISASRGRVETNTLLDLQLDPGVKPVTASRHF